MGKANPTTATEVAETLVTEEPTTEPITPVSIEGENPEVAEDDGEGEG